jgi:predicted proteasome-type protease
MPKDNIEQKQHLIDLMNMENKEAMALVKKYYKILTKHYAENDFAQIIANAMWYNEAIDCAKLDLTNTIEENLSVIEMLKLHGNERCIFAVKQRIKDLKQQLEYLNNL